MDALSERSQCKTCQLEMLVAPGNPDDRYEKKESEQDMNQGNGETGYQEPDNIQDGCQATRQFGVYPECAPKGPETEYPDLDHLETKGDTNNSDHHGGAPHYITNGSYQSAKQKPDNVSKDIHTCVHGFIWKDTKKPEIHYTLLLHFSEPKKHADAIYIY